MSRGLFIVFEGGEGGGKSTQVELLANRLRDDGHQVLVTREPGGTQVAESIRELLLDPANSEMTARAEALLFAAARAEHVSQRIAPALDRGEIVICDRFVDSSIAYQGAGRGLGMSEIAEVNRWATLDIAADLTIVLDVDPRVGLARARDVNDPDRMESLDIAFHETVRDAFRQLAAVGDAYVVLDASQPPTETATAVWGAVAPLLSDADRRQG